MIYTFRPFRLVTLFYRDAYVSVDHIKPIFIAVAKPRAYLSPMAVTVRIIDTNLLRINKRSRVQN